MADIDVTISENAAIEVTITEESIPIDVEITEEITQITCEITSEGPQGIPGIQGNPGDDGFSPVVSSAEIIGGHTVSIQDATHTETFPVMDGEKGDPGYTPQKDVDYFDGEDGYSPSASVVKVGNKATITITDKDGTTTAEVFDGSGSGDMQASTYDPAGGARQVAFADEIPEVPTALSELTDDLGDNPTHTHSQYLTEHQSLAGYATETWVENKGYLTEHQSLAGYATETWVENKGYLTEHQDISGKADKSVAVAVTIAVADWVDNTCTKSVVGVTASNNIVVAPNPTSFTDYAESVIRATAQGNGTVTFVCDAVPESSVSVNVLIVG